VENPPPPPFSLFAASFKDAGEAERDEEKEELRGVEGWRGRFVRSRQ